MKINKTINGYEYIIKDWELFFISISSLILGIIIGVIK